MKVSELIEELQTYGPNDEVLIGNIHGEWPFSVSKSRPLRFDPVTRQWVTYHLEGGLKVVLLKHDAEAIMLTPERILSW